MNEPISVVDQSVYDHLYSSPINVNKLKLVCLNICGLRSKLKYPDFEEFVNKYDIICLSETQLDFFDKIVVENYKYHGVFRKNAAKKSGGVGILVRNNLWSKVDFLERSYKNCIWFQLDEALLNARCVFGAVYIPPEGSSYSSINIFEQIESDIVDFRSQDLLVCMLGDFNARCGTVADFISVDTHIANDLMDLDSQMLMNKNNLELLGFSSERHSEDHYCNNYGRRLIDICKSFDVHIANGRIDKDAYTGKTTCKGVSVVDYVLLSPELFPSISYFEVLPFDPILSDVHNPIAFTIGTVSALQVDEIDGIDNTITDDEENVRATWSSEVLNEFINSINHETALLLIKPMTLVLQMLSIKLRKKLVEC